MCISLGDSQHDLRGRSRDSRDQSVPVIALDFKMLNAVIESENGRSQLGEITSVCDIGIISEHSEEQLAKTLNQFSVLEFFNFELLSANLDDFYDLLDQKQRLPEKNHFLLISADSSLAAKSPNHGHKFKLVPGLPLVLGCLAGEEILLAKINYEQISLPFALELLGRYSVAPIYKCHLAQRFYIAYVCGSTIAELVAQGMQVTELLTEDQCGTSHLYLAMRFIEKRNLIEDVGGSVLNGTRLVSLPLRIARDVKDDLLNLFQLVQLRSDNIYLE